MCSTQFTPFQTDYFFLITSLQLLISAGRTNIRHICRAMSSKPWVFAQPHSQGHVLGSTQVHHSLSGRNKTTLGSGTEGTTKCLHGRGRHKDTVCPIWCRTTVLRKTTHQSRLGLHKQAVPAVTGRAVTTPGHISTGFIVQLFCPESACVEQSRQEAAGQSCAHVPRLCPEHAAAWEPSTKH